MPASLGSLPSPPLRCKNSLTQIALNITALTRLTQAVLPGFVARNRGVIVNIASVLGIQTLPISSVYSGTKAFVLAFSRGLQAELAETAVKVQVVLPAATATEIWDASGVPLTALDANTVMTTENLVDAAIAGFDQGEAVTWPSLADDTLWERFETARADLFAGTRTNRPAPRYTLNVRGNGRASIPLGLASRVQQNPARLRCALGGCRAPGGVELVLDLGRLGRRTDRLFDLLLGRLDLHVGDTLASDAELLGRTLGQIDVPSLRERTTVVDLDLDLLVGGGIGHRHRGAQRQGRMRGCHGVGVVLGTAGGLLPRQLVAVERGLAFLLEHHRAWILGQGWAGEEEPDQRAFLKSHDHPLC